MENGTPDDPKTVISVLHEITQSMRMKHDSGKWFRQIYVQISRLCVVDAFFIAQLNAQASALEFSCLICDGKHYCVDPIQTRDPLVLSTLNSKQVTLKHRVDAVIYGKSDFILSEAIGMNCKTPISVLYTPIMLDDTVIGIIGILNHDANNFTDWHAELMQVISGQVAVKIYIDRLKANAAELMQQYGNVLDQMPYGIGIISPDRNVQFMNKAMQSIAGDANNIRTCDELCRNVRHTCDQCVQFLEEQESQITDYAGRSWHITSQVLGPATASASRLLIFREIGTHDIPDDEFLRIEKFKAVFSLVGAIAHKLNQPLTGITCYSSMILEDINEDNTYYQEICEIDSQAHRLEALIRKFQRITKLENIDYLSETEILDLDKSADDRDHDGA